MRNSLAVTIALDELVCIDEGDGPGDAEPYLWVLSYKVDGDTYRLGADGRLHGRPTFKRVNGGHGNLWSTDVGDGDTVRIPAIVGRWETQLKPITIEPGPWKDAIKRKRGWDDLPGVIGMAWVLMEEDNLPGNAAHAGYQAFASTLETELTNAVGRLGVLRPELADEDMRAIRDAVRAAPRKAIMNHLDVIEKLWLWVTGPDQSLGDGDIRAGGDELLARGRIDYRLRWKDGVNVSDPIVDGVGDFLAAGPGRFVESGGEWEIRGHMSGTEIVIPPGRKFRVECVDAGTMFGRNYRIHSLGVRDEAGRFMTLSRGEVMDLIGRGDRFYVESGEGARSWVSVYEPLPTEPRNYRHLRTTSDGIEGNNLRSLPRCA